MALPKPYKKPPPPKQTFIRELDDFEVDLVGRGDDTGRLSAAEFLGLISDLSRSLNLAILDLAPGETLFFRPMVCGYDGGIEGFVPVAERVESDEEYAARLKLYEDNAARKALSKVKTREEEIAALEARLAKLKETP